MLLRIIAAAIGASTLTACSQPEEPVGELLMTGEWALVTVEEVAGAATRGDDLLVELTPAGRRVLEELDRAQPDLASRLFVAGYASPTPVALNDALEDSELRVSNMGARLDKLQDRLADRRARPTLVAMSALKTYDAVLIESSDMLQANWGEEGVSFTPSPRLAQRIAALNAAHPMGRWVLIGAGRELADSFLITADAERFTARISNDRALALWREEVGDKTP